MKGIVMIKRGYLLILALFLIPSLAGASSGEDILTEKCSRCHATPDFSQYDAETWAQYVDRMAPNAALNDQEIEAVKALNTK